MNEITFDAYGDNLDEIHKSAENIANDYFGDVPYRMEIDASPVAYLLSGRPVGGWLGRCQAEQVPSAPPSSVKFDPEFT